MFVSIGTFYITFYICSTTTNTWTKLVSKVSLNRSCRHFSLRGDWIGNESTLRNQSSPPKNAKPLMFDLRSKVMFKSQTFNKLCRRYSNVPKVALFPTKARRNQCVLQQGCASTIALLNRSVLQMGPGPTNQQPNLRPNLCAQNSARPNLQNALSC